MPRTIQDVLLVMNDMVSLEVALAELYEACSARFPEDRNFWLAIRNQEQLHAQSIGKLAELVSSHPREFTFGRPFNPGVIKTILASVRSYTEQVQKGQLQRQRALFIARDLENSVLEAHYSDVVSTSNVEFGKAIEAITKDTLAHKNLFAAKVARSKS